MSHSGAKPLAWWRHPTTVQPPETVELTSDEDREARDRRAAEVRALVTLIDAELSALHADLGENDEDTHDG